MREEDIHSVISLLRKETAKWEAPIVGRISSKDPFRVLISTLLSSRTKDDITEKACNRLFAKADTPEKMYKLTETELFRAVEYGCLDCVKIIIENGIDPHSRFNYAYHLAVRNKLNDIVNYLERF